MTFLRNRKYSELNIYFLIISYYVLLLWYAQSAYCRAMFESSFIGHALSYKNLGTSDLFYIRRNVAHTVGKFCSYSAFLFVYRQSLGFSDFSLGIALFYLSQRGFYSVDEDIYPN